MSLASRAASLRAVRSFFHERGILEVDTRLLNPHGSLDTHIEAFHVPGEGYLIPSPEYNMKQLLSEGAPDIYQLSHVFRKDERGAKHDTEFTLIEYYRVGMSYEAFIDEVIDLVRLFTHETTVEWTTYSDQLETHAPDRDNDDLAWGTLVEPHLQALTVVDAFPSSALAKGRFEIYCRGLELANGYLEREDSPLLPFTIPPCCGVALGFDRLMMLKENAPTLSAILPQISVQNKVPL